MELPTLDKFPPRILASIDVQRAFIVSRLVIAAERMQLFRILRGQPRKADWIGRRLDIHPGFLQTFLNAMVSLGLLRRSGDRYTSTRFAEKYFVTERSIYWTRQYSKECLQAYRALAVLEQALASGRSCTGIAGLDKPSYVEAMKRDPQQAEDFTQMLFHFHQQDAAALASHLALGGRRSLLDVGGGSGVMSIALAKANPELKARILDIAPVCDVAKRNIRRAGLARRVVTIAGDITRKLPSGDDVVMFCDIGPVSPGLLRNAFASLPPGGLVAAVDRYLTDDGTRPLDRLLATFVGSSTPPATRSGMVKALRNTGFEGVKARKVYRDLWVITGTKPAQGRMS